MILFIGGNVQIHLTFRCDHECLAELFSSNDRPSPYLILLTPVWSFHILIIVSSCLGFVCLPALAFSFSRAPPHLISPAFCIVSVPQPIPQLHLLQAPLPNTPRAFHQKLKNRLLRTSYHIHQNFHLTHAFAFSTKLSAVALSSLYEIISLARELLIFLLRFKTTYLTWRSALK